MPHATGSRPYRLTPGDAHGRAPRDHADDGVLGWDDVGVWFVRYQSAAMNSRGTYPGVFALANGLAHAGQLNAADWAWWRASNDALELAYIDPATVDPAIFDRTAHPRVSCWFKESATHLLDLVAGYTALLDRYAVRWVRLHCQDPGMLLYEDADQIVVAPRAAEGPEPYECLLEKGCPARSCR